MKRDDSYDHRIKGLQGIATVGEIKNHRYSRRERPGWPQSSRVIESNDEGQIIHHPTQL